MNFKKGNDAEIVEPDDDSEGKIILGENFMKIQARGESTTKKNVPSMTSAKTRINNGGKNNNKKKKKKKNKKNIKKKNKKKKKGQLK